MVNNPSNPCGSAFSKQHCLDIIELADRYKLPIIADEVYANVVYDHNSQFHSLTQLTSDVPIIVFLIVLPYSKLPQFLKCFACRDGEWDG